ncbi:RNA polymerase III RPC4-domain-containing protein [Polychytrium aggregatum]|uniref:RNA polymerase III RPC4-domain-containing protein n=1 Tax=Polychytrium aggregatum TaxID=110093 RepID=UPI0022FDF963|nr:RNA polymerase III RPC4-domain-containing protein [Polychytrium aggregatum]KAI9205344.1 RNA polymerase III RPC4-domain-containing protein [Polychytrium aggregatum]
MCPRSLTQPFSSPYPVFLRQLHTGVAIRPHPVAGDSSSGSKPKFAPRVPPRKVKTESATEAAPTPTRTDAPRGRGRGRGRGGSEAGRGSRGGRGGGRGRGRGREEPVLSMAGPFAMGPAAYVPRTRAATAIVTPSAPVSAKSEVIAEQFDDVEGPTGFDPSDNWTPVELGSIRSVLAKPPTAIKSKKIKIKPDPDGDVSMGTAGDDIIDEEEEPNEPVKPESLRENVFDAENPTHELLHFQFPAVLPKLESMPVDGDTIPIEDFSRHPFSRFEGKLGKLVVRRSGAAQIKMGNIVFDVAPAPDINMLQQLVVVKPEAGRAVVLGDVKKRLVCTPNLDSLLK